MLPRYHRALLATLLMVVAGHWLYAQPHAPSIPITPDDLTNRRMAYLNDASAVGWNPALLGVQYQIHNYDLILGVPYNTSLDVPELYTGFAKIGPVALGTTASFNPDSVIFTRQYFAGLGYPVIEDEVWVGAAAQWLDGAGFFESAEYRASVMWRPRIDLLASIGASNLSGNNGHGTAFNIDGTWLTTEWLNVFAGLRYDGSDTVGERDPLNLNAGLSFNLFQGHVVLSAQYDLGLKGFRLGAEFGLGQAVAGLIQKVYDDNGDGSTGFASGGAFLRYSSDEKQVETPTAPIDPAIARLGWAPDRAYTPPDQLTDVSDALRTMETLQRPCTPGAADPFQTPEGLVRAVNDYGPYAPMQAMLREAASNPAELYPNIRSQHYSSSVRGSSELQSGDTLQILSRQGYSIGVQQIDNSKFPRMSVIMQVTDKFGHTVQNLGAADFRFRDTATKILSVKPTDSSFSVPVDVVMMIDCSGSMSEEITAVLNNARGFVDTMVAQGADYRIGGVLYGSLIYDTLHPTKDFAEFRDFVSNAKAIGGDEISTLAIKAATEMSFRPNAQRVFILITDDWVIQNNARLREHDLVKALWNARARFYLIGDPCRNNAPLLSQLTLGSEYNIRDKFDQILDQIGNDITTTYELVYESKLPEKPKITMVQGRVRDENGRPRGVTISLNDGNTVREIVSNPTTGEFQLEIPEGARYIATAQGVDFLPLLDTLDMTSVKKGDTVSRDFTLRLETTLTGVVTDENNRPVPSEVRIDDATTGQRIATLKTGPDGRYKTPIAEGRNYRIAAYATDYIPTPVELDTRTTEKGSKLVQDLKVMSIDYAIANGATFKLKNIFFDTDKWDLKPESFAEIDRLVALLNEYPVLKVEIGAHTDSRASDEHNNTLSGRRAKSVVDYLISKGIDQTRLSSKGYGETTPVATNDTDEGRQLNRRVEFKLVR